MFSGVTFFLITFKNKLNSRTHVTPMSKKGLMQHLEGVSVPLNLMPIGMFWGVTFILYILKILV